MCPAKNLLHLLPCEPYISAFHVLQSDMPEIYPSHLPRFACSKNGPGGALQHSVIGVGGRSLGSPVSAGCGFSVTSDISKGFGQAKLCGMQRCQRSLFRQWARTWRPWGCDSGTVRICIPFQIWQLCCPICYSLVALQVESSISVRVSASLIQA